MEINAAKKRADKVEAFLNSINDPIVYLEKGSAKGSLFDFDVRFDLSVSPYVKVENYDAGHAYVYLNEAFYKKLDEEAVRIFGGKVNWNNTGTSGWIVT